jgi:hypothetical protein
MQLVERLHISENWLFTAVTIKNTMFWAMTLFSMVGIRRRSSEYSENFYQTRWRHIPEDSILQHRSFVTIPIQKNSSSLYILFGILFGSRKKWECNKKWRIQERSENIKIERKEERSWVIENVPRLVTITVKQFQLLIFRDYVLQTEELSYTSQFPSITECAFCSLPLISLSTYRKEG